MCCKKSAQPTGCAADCWYMDIQKGATPTGYLKIPTRNDIHDLSGDIETHNQSI